MANQPLDNYPGLSPVAGTSDKYMQFGTVKFTNNATDVSVRTQLTHIDVAVATYNVASSVTTLMTDGGAALSITTSPSSGAITISRPNTTNVLAAATDGQVSYFLIGRVYSTD